MEYVSANFSAHNYHIHINAISEALILAFHEEDLVELIKHEISINRIGNNVNIGITFFANKEWDMAKNIAYVNDLVVGQVKLLIGVKPNNIAVEYRLP